MKSLGEQQKAALLKRVGEWYDKLYELEGEEHEELGELRIFMQNAGWVHQHKDGTDEERAFNVFVSEKVKLLESI